MEKARLAIHTYPFKYRSMTAAEIFRPQEAAVYIHVPFCDKKCHFCDFVVRTNASTDLRQRYVDAVCAEIDLFARTSGLGDFRVTAVYIGGGTPSLLTDAQLIRLIDACRSRLTVTDNAELTIEFEPLTVSRGKIYSLSRAGLNRASMGVQSFADSLLIASNRSHKAADVYRALDVFGEAGLRNVNIDLIYPLPGLTREIWESTVESALSIHPAALSIYALEIWPETSYDRWNSAGTLGLPNAKSEVDMYLYAARLLEENGYTAESVNGYVDHAIAARYCSYLDYYWRLRPVLGFGVSARSLCDGRLWRNSNNINSYLSALAEDKLPVELGWFMTRQQEMRRFMIRGLKACVISKNDFLGRFGVEMRQMFDAELTSLTADGWLADDGDSVRLTRLGRAFAPNVYQRFFTATDLGGSPTGEVTYGVSTWTS